MRARRNTLSWQLLKAVLSMYFSITVVVTLTQMTIEYYHTRGMIRDEMARIEATFRPALATALWELNDGQQEAILRGIVDLPAISAVTLVARDGKERRMTSGERELGHGVAHAFKVSYRFSGEDIDLATVTFEASGKVVLDRILLGFQMIVVSALIKSTVLASLFILIFRRRLGEPLGRFAREVAAVDLGSLGRKHIDLGLPQENELTELEHSFNRMLRALDDERRASDAAIEAVNQGLEEEVRKRTEELEAANRKLAELATTDGLTGLANRRRFDEVLAAEWARSRRTARPLALIMIDIDHFKRYNDALGHQAGDDCLVDVARAIHGGARRAGELVARYGGEEFAVIATDADAAKARELAETIRGAVMALALPHAATSYGMVTVSIGFAALVPNERADAEDLLREADQALYRAKENGRNRSEGE